MVSGPWLTYRRGMSPAPATQPADLSLTDWNWAVLMLHQALIGAISPNFRMVELAYKSSTWVVRVTLSIDDPTDREEVEDVCDTFGGSLDDVAHLISTDAYTKAVPDIIISTGPIILQPNGEPRVVFRSRDQS